MIRLFASTAAAALLAAAPALAQNPPPADPHAGHVMPSEPPKPAAQAPMDHSQMDHAKPPETAPAASDHTGHDMAGMDMSGMDHGAPTAMPAALGPYGMTREASGTAWQPDVSAHEGIHSQVGGWSVMQHVLLNGVYDKQGGPRGDSKTFVSGMYMASAQRAVGGAGTLRLRAMLSPDPLMGRRGYPLLLASGESADGVTPLIDRQHPHDLFMELSASYSVRLSAKDSVFLYAGLPGEPAFGPPAFMHRLSIMDSPEAPISHHWLDSTHITFGVLTGGFVHDNWKVEVSRFKGREPDDTRYDIENPKLDSTAVRLSWNPTERLALQGSWAHQKSPEALDPHEDQEKWSASAIYTFPLGAGRWWSTTAAWGRRTADGGPHLDAYVLESAVKPSVAWTVFGRAERTENNELGGSHGPAYTVGKASLGAVHDWKLAQHVKFGLGGLYAWNWVPAGLAASYDGDRNGGMAFVRLKIE